MPEIQGDTGGSSADQTTAVSDEGASFGGGGMMDWSGIGDMVDGSVSKFHENTLPKQRGRGDDACVLAASIEEGWYTQIGPAWWKSSGLARTVANSLNRAIGEAVVNKGKARPTKYDNAVPLWKFMINQVGIAALLPEEVIATANAIGLSPAGAAGAQAFREEYVKSHLPTGRQLERLDIDTRERGLALGDKIYLYGSGCSANPTPVLGSTERLRCLEQGRYSGPGMYFLVEAWLGELIARVTPKNFSSARSRLESFTGSWQGSSRWGVWDPQDGFSVDSKLGFLDEFRVNWFGRQLAESQVLCEEQRQEDYKARRDIIEAGREGQFLAASRWWAASAAVAFALFFRERR